VLDEVQEIISRCEADISFHEGMSGELEAVADGLEDLMDEVEGISDAHGAILSFRELVIDGH